MGKEVGTLSTTELVNYPEGPPNQPEA